MRTCCLLDFLLRSKYRQFGNHQCLLWSTGDGKDGGHGADPGFLLDAGACVGSHGFAAGVCFVRIPCLSAFFSTKIMLPSMNELPPCPTMVLLSQDVRLGWASDDSHG